MSRTFRLEIEGLRRLEKARQSSEGAHQRLLESIFLNGVTEFESFLEDVFFAAVSKRIHPGKTKALVDLRDSETARSILMRPGERYLNWMPIEYSLERAEQFLSNGLPFSRLGSRPSVKQRLEIATAVRNAVAHKSGRARERFNQVTSGKYRTPGAYLSARLASGTICDGFLDDFARYGHALCVSDAEAVNLLGPEGPYTAGTKVDPRTYRCQICETEYVLQERGALACPICDPPCDSCGVSTSRRAKFGPVDD
jgi:hypothetical protein